MRKFRKGFTLAEVLITLTIIGVVAALTAPALVNNAGFARVGPSLAKFVNTFEIFLYLKRIYTLIWLIFHLHSLHLPFLQSVLLEILNVQIKIFHMDEYLKR